MADITITINTDNAAFQDDPEELARRLYKIADDARDCGEDIGQAVMDSNGNKVGEVTIDY